MLSIPKIPGFISLFQLVCLLCQLNLAKERLGVAAEASSSTQL